MTPKKDTDASGYFLWSGTRPEGDFPVWLRVVLLPFYLVTHGYHCLRGTPVYIQYGNHEHRITNDEDN